MRGLNIQSSEIAQRQYHRQCLVSRKNDLLRPVVTILLLSILIAEGQQQAYAIPLFARKYNTSCFTCHTTEPLLNEFGYRFQANGYQLPGTNEKLSIWDQSPAPVGILASPMFSHARTEDNISGTSTMTNTFSGIEVAVFNAGSLGSHFSFFTEIPVAIEEGNTTIEINDAHLIYSDLLGDGLKNLNFRLGKMRLFIPFIPNVLLSNADPLVYGYNTLAEKTSSELLFAEPTFGASAFGIFPQVFDGLRWELAVTSGTKSDVDLKSAHALFASLNQTIFFDNTLIRAGVFFYGGSEDVTDTSVAPTVWSNAVNRVGISAEITDPWTKRINLFGEFIYANDNNSDASNGALRMDGGFVGVNVMIIPEEFYGFGRYDFMMVKQTEETRRQIDIGLRYHVLKNVIITSGFNSTKQTIPNRVDQTVLTLTLGTLFGF